MSLNMYSTLLMLCWLLACISLSGIITSQFQTDELSAMYISSPVESTVPVDYSHIPIKIWTSDFHISTVYDIKHILSQLGNVSVIDKSLSGHCHLTNTCQVNLKVITSANGINLLPCPNRLRKLFYSSYVDDPEFQSADAFLCTHASSMCELYMPFGKPLIVVASTRYEIGRHGAGRWEDWNDNLRRIAGKPGNVVAANNIYDQEYIRYFTGLPPTRLPSLNQPSSSPNTSTWKHRSKSDRAARRGVGLLPSLCSYVQARHRPGPGNKPEVLIAPGRGVNAAISAQLLSTAAKYRSQQAGVGMNNAAVRNSTGPSQAQQALDQSNERGGLVPPIRHLRELYPHYEYSDLAVHPAVIILPYQVSFMLFFELYQMGIPLFVPSPSLLADWHIQYRVLSERSWGLVYGEPTRSSTLPIHADYADTLNALHTDPNNEFDRDALLEWVSLADFYQLPHTVHFSTLEDLMQQLSSSLLQERLLRVSAAMMMHNEERNIEVQGQWAAVVDGLRQWKHLHRPAFSSSSSQPDGTKERDIPLHSVGLDQSSSFRDHRASEGRRSKALNDALEKHYGLRLQERSCLGHTAVPGRTNLRNYQ